MYLLHNTIFSFTKISLTDDLRRSTIANTLNVLAIAGHHYQVQIRLEISFKLGASESYCDLHS